MLLEIKNIVKQYESHRALDGVSIAIPKGAIYGLLGPNGAGKTSLIRIITQITEAEEGEIFFDGEKLNSNHIAQIGYLPEERGLYKKMKVGEQLLYIAQLKGLTTSKAKEKINYWLEKFDILDWYDKSVEDLSKGMQQKIQFIATVINEPKLLILDEPFSGFDPVNANLIKDEILELNRKGATIIFSTHRMESVEELCQYITLIHHSKVVLEGTLNTIKQNYKTGIIKLVGVGNLVSNSKFSILEHQDNKYLLKKTTTISNSELLQLILNQSFEINSFEEVVPSINEIFLKLVG